jgi:hypothetical protein
MLRIPLSLRNYVTPIENETGWMSLEGFLEHNILARDQRPSISQKESASIDCWTHTSNPISVIFYIFETFVTMTDYGAEMLRRQLAGKRRDESVND